MGNERRRGGDRRINDIGPPASREDKRISVERRLPDVHNFDIDEHVEIVSAVLHFDDDFPPPLCATA
ncbi:MAG: hypothetical protein WCA83_07745 [Azonexus sp.]|jgi:hypothetical protein